MLDRGNETKIRAKLLEKSEALNIWDRIDSEFDTCIVKNAIMLEQKLEKEQPDVLEFIDVLGGLEKLVEVTLQHLCFIYYRSKHPEMGNPADVNFSDSKVNKQMFNMFSRLLQQSLLVLYRKRVSTLSVGDIQNRNFNNAINETLTHAHEKNIKKL